MNAHHVAQIALELNALPDEERDEIGRALERIVGFLNHVGLAQNETTIRELTMPMDIGGGRWERHLEFKALVRRCGVKKFRWGVEDPNYREIRKGEGTQA